MKGLRLDILAFSPSRQKIGIAYTSYVSVVRRNYASASYFEFIWLYWRQRPCGNSGWRSYHHLDAARNVIAKQKRNAALSFDNTDKNATMASVRWIVDDAVKFVKRELKESFMTASFLIRRVMHGSEARFGGCERPSTVVRQYSKTANRRVLFVMLSGHTPRYGLKYSNEC